MKGKAYTEEFKEQILKDQRVIKPAVKSKISVSTSDSHPSSERKRPAC